jgi:hypothetical protein
MSENRKFWGTANYWKLVDRQNLEDGGREPKKMRPEQAKDVLSCFLNLDFPGLKNLRNPFSVQEMRTGDFSEFREDRCSELS